MSLLNTTSRLAERSGWSSAVDEMLRQVVHDGFAFHMCGERTVPVVLVASYYWENYVDLLTIAGPNRFTAARAIRGRDFDVFRPRSVVWAYGNEPEATLHALLELNHPDHPDHPTHPHDPPRLMIVPADLQRPLTFKAPEPWNAGNRTRRLETALACQLTERAACGLLNDATEPQASTMLPAHSGPGSAA